MVSVFACLVYLTDEIVNQKTFLELFEFEIRQIVYLSYGHCYTG